jgi:hypothetical protein
MPIINNTPGQPIYSGTGQPPFEQPRNYAPPEPTLNTQAILGALEQFAQQLTHMKQAQAITREAFRRLAQIPEGDLLALEKKILDELHQPKGAVTLDQVDDLIGKRLEQHGAQLIQVIDNLVVGILQGQRPQAPKIHDPLGTAPDPTPQYPDDITEEEDEVGETILKAAEEYPIPEEEPEHIQTISLPPMPPKQKKQK